MSECLAFFLALWGRVYVRMYVGECVSMCVEKGRGDELYSVGVRKAKMQG